MSEDTSLSNSAYCLAVSRDGSPWSWVTDVGGIHYDPKIVVYAPSTSVFENVIYVPAWGRFVVVGRPVSISAPSIDGGGGGDPGDGTWIFDYITNLAYVKSHGQLSPSGTFVSSMTDADLAVVLANLWVSAGLPPPEGHNIGLAGEIFSYGYQHSVPSGDITALHVMTDTTTGGWMDIQFGSYSTYYAWTDNRGAELPNTTADTSGVVAHTFTPPPVSEGSTGPSIEITVGPNQIYTSKDGVTWDFGATYDAKSINMSASQTPFQDPVQAFPAGFLKFI